ncbi:MAG: SRPBCC family protein [Bacteroidetes bacterium]|nr:SRPBCC family protein [Bacteroidota bacterium]
MITHTLQSEQWIERPRDEVFSFFSDASNLERITPSELKFKILSPQPIEMKTGALIDYQLVLAGIPFKWKTEITDWNPPHSFKDTQLKGPYAKWIHTHAFEDHGDRTRIVDTVEYSLPLSPLGDLAWPIIRFQLSRIFAHRKRVVDTVFQR